MGFRQHGFSLNSSRIVIVIQDLWNSLFPSQIVTNQQLIPTIFRGRIQKMFFLWPAGLCFLAFQICHNCTREHDVNKALCSESGTCDLTGGGSEVGYPFVHYNTKEQISVQVATVAGSYGECGKDVFPGLYVRIDDPKVLRFINNVSNLAEKVLETKLYSCPTVDRLQCTFPFQHNGHKFDSCTTDNRCAIRTEKTGDVSAWGTCSSECPRLQLRKKSCEASSGETRLDCSLNEILESESTTQFEPATTELTTAFGFTPATTPPSSQDTAQVRPNVSSQVVGPTGGRSPSCIYTCRARGSCTVRLQNDGLVTGSHDGIVQGFCFSELFGGKCAGIPKFCQPCLALCANRLGEQFTVTLNKDRSESIATNSDFVDTSSKFNVVPLVKPGQSDSCLYLCQENRGCSVEILTASLISGSVKGSCFPPSFGGTCSGTPDGCQPCLEVCGSKPGEEIQLPVNRTLTIGKQFGDGFQQTIDPNKVDLASLIAPNRTDSCVYSCQKSGVCSIDIVSDSFITGNIKGSCFPPAFGGKCTGIPKGCQPCLDICKIEPGGRFIVPIGGSGNVSLIGKFDEPNGGPAILTCHYSCKVAGGCSVRIVSSRGFYQGNSLGSCFSPAMGGACSGTPDKCRDCLGVCQGRLGETFKLPAKE